MDHGRGKGLSYNSFSRSQTPLDVFYLEKAFEKMIEKSTVGNGAVEERGDFF